MIVPVVPVLAGLGVVIVAIGARVYAGRRRREALEQYCLVRGYRFERQRPGAEAELAGVIAIFRQGRHRRWGATISGTVGGRPFTAFEYQYVTGGGNSSKRHGLVILLYESPEAHLPRFSLAPEGFFMRFFQRFGIKDFDFPDDPEFSKAYQLQGDDEAAVRALFTPVRRAFFTEPALDGGKPPRHHLAGAGPRLLWWRAGRLPKPEALDQFLADGDRVRRQFLD